MIVTVHEWIWRRLPVVVYCIAIFIQSSLPAPQPVVDFQLNDKLLHVAGYALLGALFLRAFQTIPFKTTARMLLLSILCASLYGLTDEIHQFFVPSRNCDIWDGVADGVGSVLGVTAYHLFWKFKGSKK